MRNRLRVMLAVVLLALAAAPAMVWARYVDCADALDVGKAFTDSVIQRYGGWGESSVATVQGCSEFRAKEEVLGYFLPVSPRGYIMVNPLTQMDPVKAYSTESDLDVTQEGGFAKLLKDTMGKTRNFLERSYGPLERIPDTLEIGPAKNRESWDHLLGQGPLLQDLAGETAVSSLTMGPLLTSS
jgi:hypothetical protein